MLKVEVMILLFLVLLCCHAQETVIPCGRNIYDERNLDVPENLLGKHPWAASYGLLEGARWKHQCGGTVISDRQILTAYHCFRELDLHSSLDYQIRVGDVSFDDNNVNSNRVQYRTVVCGTIHPSRILDGMALYYDVTILHLDQPLKFTDYVRPICLPESPTDYENSFGTIIGWGYGLDSLKEAAIQVYPEAHCNSTYVVDNISNLSLKRKSQVALPDLFNSSVLCGGSDGAGTSGVGACSGDSGGPNIIFDPFEEGRYVQIGIVSGGIACTSKPGVYTNLGDESILNFVKKVLNEKEIVEEFLHFHLNNSEGNSNNCPAVRASDDPQLYKISAQKDIEFQSIPGSDFLEASSCNFQGLQIIEILHVSANNCYKECQGYEECSHYTWVPFQDGTCILKSGRLDPKPEVEQRLLASIRCGYRQLTQEPDVSSSLEWEISEWSKNCEFYDENFAIEFFSTREECSSSCASNQECSHYTWKRPECGLKRGPVTQDDAFRSNDFEACGFKEVKESEEKSISDGSDWHMIVGGKNSSSVLNSIELFNWRTKEQCHFGNLPNPVRLHSGIVLNGVPVICGGINPFYQVQDSCYKYENDEWKPIAELVVPASSSSSNAFVPNKGWMIYGSETSDITRALRLKGLEEDWEFGLDFYDLKTNAGQCVIQLNNSTTAFLGGKDSSQQILTFDWISLRHTKHKEELNGKRWNAACALAIGPGGEQLVAIAGGTHAEGRGMEIWNPVKGTVEIVTPVLPKEREEDLVGLEHAQLLPVNGGRELLLFGGNLGDHGQVTSDIWKYNVDRKSWKKVNEMLEPRGEHVVLQVSSIQCLVPRSEDFSDIFGN